MVSTRRTSENHRTTTSHAIRNGTGETQSRRRTNTIDGAPLPPNAPGMAVRGDRMPDVGRARRGEKEISFGSLGDKGRSIGLSQLTGQFTIDGTKGDKQSKEALAIYGAAELAASGVDIASKVKTN